MAKKLVNFRIDEELYTMLITCAKLYNVKLVDIARAAMGGWLYQHVLKHLQDKPESDWTPEDREIAQLYLNLPHTLYRQDFGKRMTVIGSDSAHGRV